MNNAAFFITIYLLGVWFISMFGKDVREPAYDNDKKLGSRIMLAAWIWPVVVVVALPPLFAYLLYHWCTRVVGIIKDAKLF